MYSVSMHLHKRQKILYYIFAPISREIYNFLKEFLTALKTTAIISEFNPLHKGHEYAVKAAANNGADAVVAIMSSDFVQRGEAAIMPAVYRARLALAAGCDLVLELPAPYSFASAEYFAYAGVFIAQSIGVCDGLLFGSEAGDMDRLIQARERLDSHKFASTVSELSQSGRSMGHMQLRYEASRQLYTDDFAELVSSPNNILALEYIKASQALGGRLSLRTIKRTGSDYNDTESAEGFVSAGFLRKKIYAHEDFLQYVPNECASVYREAENKGVLGASLERAESAVLAFLRMTSPEKLSQYAEICDGLEYRLCKSACEASDLNGVFEFAATKKYTNARIRRALLCCMLGVTEADLKATPAYVRALAANEKGLELLKHIKEHSSVPVVTNVSGLKGLEHSNQYTLARRADALYSLTLPQKMPAGELFKQGIYVGKK